MDPPARVRQSFAVQPLVNSGKAHTRYAFEMPYQIKRVLEIPSHIELHPETVRLLSESISSCRGVLEASVAVAPKEDARTLSVELLVDSDNGGHAGEIARTAIRWRLEALGIPKRQTRLIAATATPV